MNNMMTRIRPKHLHIASLIITAVSLAVGMNQPVNAQKSALFGSQEKTAIVAKKTKPMRLSAVSPPEAGVQLLMGILQRIGNEPQIAAVPSQSQMRQDDAGSNFLASQNAVEPALVIRPQASQQLKRSKPSSAKAVAVAKPTSSEQLLKMIPQNRRVQVAANEESGGSLPPASWGKSVTTPGDNAYGGGRAADAAAGAPAGDHWKKLEGNINKLYQATRFVEEITNKKAGADADAAPSDELANALADSESRVIKSGYYQKGTTTSSYPRITEYGKGSQQIAAAPASQQSYLNLDRRAMNGLAGASPNIIPMESAEAKRERDSSDKSQTNAKLDQPGLYKYTKEYGSTPLTEGMEINLHAKEKLKQARASGFGSGTQIAYLPPQLVSGIPGLRLGVPEEQVDAYLKGKGKVTRQKFNSWKVLSLNSEKTNKTLLQIYVRGGAVEAFRIFDQAFVPEGLGVALADKLPNMKKKFGEQQFILNEPAPQGEGSTARNYVYPVNQVSFQLARSNPKEPPTIQSLLLFQFL